MNLILFGAPGAGKGTQSAMLVEKLGMTQISTGDLFRAAIKNKTELGTKAQSYMNAGQLVPDLIVIGMVEEVLKSGVKSFILDGFPRTVPQAEALDALLNELKFTISKAIFLEVPKQELLGRLTGRRVCKNCGSVFHMLNKPSKIEGVCDVCGGQVVQRSDDMTEVIEARLKNYDEYTSPLKAYYTKSHKYVEVDGNRDTAKVFTDIKKLIS